MSDIKSIIKELDEVSNRIDKIKNELNVQNPDHYVVTSRIQRLDKYIEALTESSNYNKRIKSWIKSIIVILSIFVCIFLLSELLIKWNDILKIFSGYLLLVVALVLAIIIFTLIIDQLLSMKKRKRTADNIELAREKLKEIRESLQ